MTSRLGQDARPGGQACPLGWRRAHARRLLAELAGPGWAHTDDRVQRLALDPDQDRNLRDCACTVLELDHMRELLGQAGGKDGKYRLAALMK